MTQNALLGLPENVAGEHSLGECLLSPSVEALLFGARRRIVRSEVRECLRAPLWLTSLRKPGVFEVVATENVSRLGIQIVTQELWEPAGLVLVSSPPGFWVQGSVVYCKKLPSDDYLLGIRLDTPVEHWIEALRLGGALTGLNLCTFRISNETSPGVPSLLLDQG